MPRPQRLVDRHPDVEPPRLLAEFVPPAKFGPERVSFDTYLPSPEHPSQAAALTAVRAFAERVEARDEGRRRLFRRGALPDGRPGIYLDGGFGVGKTHLLAALWHAVDGPAAFGSFIGYTHLVGALGFGPAVEVLSSYRLVCIDEFELDDPGDTVLMSTLLGKLAARGVRLAATSNTLPDRLGDGRFAAEDFLREIQGLAAHFEVVRVDGEDYRHRGTPVPPVPLTDAEVTARAEATSGATLDHFVDLERHLVEVHPSRYGALVDGVRAVHLIDARTVTDQARALRLVVLADRLYDRDVPVVASGVPLDRLFSTEMLAGGYRKKYFRAISRLIALTRQVEEPRT